MMELTISVLLWGYVAAYCIHIVEEYSVDGGFITMMRKHFWPQYTARMFFGFNTMLLSALVFGLCIFDTLGGYWIIWPLSFAFLFVTNGLWHLIQTIVLQEYSPGLITSPIYWMIMYFIIKYYYLTGEIAVVMMVISVLIGTALTLLMFASAYYQRIHRITKINHQ